MSSTASTDADTSAPTTGDTGQARNNRRVTVTLVPRPAPSDSPRSRSQKTKDLSKRGRFTQRPNPPHHKRSGGGVKLHEMHSGLGDGSA